MTRRLILVNLSNWENEDYKIVHSGGEQTISPGEKVELPLPHGDPVQVVAHPVDNPDVEGKFNPATLEVEVPHN